MKSTCLNKQVLSRLPSIYDFVKKHQWKWKIFRKIAVPHGEMIHILQ